MEDQTADWFARTVHIGRQAIYDRVGDVVAYELLFRDTAEALSAGDRSMRATSQVIVAAFTDFGILELSGDKACFINVTREFVVGELPLPFDSGQVGLEILADVPADDEVVRGVEDLVARGYTIALDQFAAGQARESLLPYVSYVKIDMLDTNPVRARQAMALCREHPHLQLIAERIETPPALLVATSLGFELFQGHALGRPHLVTTQTFTPSRINRLHLLTQLTAEDVDRDEVIATIESDPALALRVLRGVNAAATGVARKVSSVADAVVLLGPRQIFEWVTLMLVADLTEGSEEMLTGALTFARMCQIVADHEGASGKAAFTAGLLTAISDVLGLSPEDLTARLPLTDDVADAVVAERGPLGRVVATVRRYQKGQVDPHPAVALPDAYLAALHWTNRNTHSDNTASTRQNVRQ